MLSTRRPNKYNMICFLIGIIFLAVMCMITIQSIHVEGEILSNGSFIFHTRTNSNCTDEQKFRTCLRYVKPRLDVYMKLNTSDNIESFIDAIEYANQCQSEINCNRVNEFYFDMEKMKEKNLVDIKKKCEEIYEEKYVKYCIVRIFQK